MRLSRRSFASGSALAALTSSCGPRRVASPHSALDDRTVDDVIARALDVAGRGGASYADIRIVRRRHERIASREDHIVSVASGETYGLGVRVVVDGAWGFASASTVAVADAERAALHAVTLARAARAHVARPVTLAPAPAVRDRWRTRVEVDPFDVSLAEKAQLLLDLWPEVRDVTHVKFASAAFETVSEHKIFASSEGSVVEQHITRVWPQLTVTAARDGQFETRAAEIPPRQAGWEHVAASRLREDARRIAEEAVEKLLAPSVEPGRRDVVLAPSNLWLTIHESVGHPTELDRAMGLEANFAGTSFATPDLLGKLRYGADIVTLYADKTTPGGLATCGYDDDGVRTQRWDLVKNGLFVGYQTTRDQAGWIGETASRGTSYAEDHKSVAFQRMPNVSLAPREGGPTLADMIAATDDGVLISGDGSWSIDHQRYNFQFSGQTFHEIKGGKITRMLRDVAYQSSSIEFWNACDMIGAPGTWELHGTLWDGKGEPAQSNAVSHGCPPARFSRVNVLDVNTRGAA
jgi:TldD protein